MEINLKGISTKEGLHIQLAQSLSLPVWYGKNWDAFWDSITGLIELPKEIEFIGFELMSKDLPEDSKQLKKCFEDLANEYPEIECRVLWN